MKSVVFYLVEPGTGCAGPYWPVYAPNDPDGKPFFVRAEIVEQGSAEALDAAVEMPKETVLNSYQLDD